MEKNEQQIVHIPFPAKAKKKPYSNRMKLQISTFNGEESIEVISDLFWRKFIVTGKGKLKEVKATPPTHE